MALYSVQVGGNRVLVSDPTTDTMALSVENPSQSATVVWGVDPAGQQYGSGAATSALATGNTITPAGPNAIFTTAGAITGVIMAPGTYDGQVFTAINNSANSITFAAVGTSNVADSTGAVIAANTSMRFTWNAAAAKWFHGN